MSKVIDAIYEDGVFKPLEKVDIKEHKKVKIILAPEVEYTAPEECNLAGIIDLAKDCPDTDRSSHHDKYLKSDIQTI